MLAGFDGAAFNGLQVDELQSLIGEQTMISELCPLPKKRTVDSTRWI